MELVSHSVHKCQVGDVAYLPSCVYSVEEREHSKLTVPDLSSLLVGVLYPGAWVTETAVYIYLYNYIYNVAFFFIRIKLILRQAITSAILKFISFFFFHIPFIPMLLATLCSNMSFYLCRKQMQEKRRQKFLVLFKTVSWVFVLKIISFCFATFPSLSRWSQRHF